MRFEHLSMRSVCHARNRHGSLNVTSMVREFSAGGVLLRRSRGKWSVAVIEPQVRPTASSPEDRSPEVLALPKGALDPGEKPEQAALREVWEETGTRGEIITKLADTKYYYVRSWGDKQRVFKIVSFYLLRYRSGRLGDIQPEMKKEVRRAFWIPLEEAPSRLSYPGERDVAKMAVEYVSEHEELAPNGTEKVKKHGIGE